MWDTNVMFDDCQVLLARMSAARFESFSDLWRMSILKPELDALANSLHPIHTPPTLFGRYQRIK